MKPIVGIVEWPYKDLDEDLIYEVTNNIVEKISKHGGIPVGIFPTQIEDFQNKRIPEIKQLEQIEKEDLNESLNMCDAIIKPGALRIYGYERYIYGYTLEHNMPYLGICAGMQIMAGHNNSNYNNVKIESDINHHSKEKHAHTIKIFKNTLLHEILKEEEILVNSRHRYEIQNPGTLSVSAYAPDGVIEAIENKDKLFQLGVQWHPENLNDIYSDRLFDSFIEHSVDYKKKIKVR